MRKGKESSIAEELEDQGYTTVDERRLTQISDEGEEAKLLLDRITTQEMMQKANLSEIESRLILDFYFEGMTTDESLQEMKAEGLKESGLTKLRIDQIRLKAVERMRRFLPRSLKKDLKEKDEHIFAEKLINEYLYPKHKDKFLMIQYLTDYFTKTEDKNKFKDFSAEENVVLSKIRYYPKNQIAQRVLFEINLMCGDNEIELVLNNIAEADSFINTVLDKVRKVIQIKFA